MHTLSKLRIPLRLIWLGIATLLVGTLLLPVRAAENIVVHGLLKNMAIVSIDGERHVLKSNEPPIKGIKLISANSEEAVVDVNGERQVLRIGKHIATQFKPPSQKSQLSIAPDQYGMYRRHGNINGFQVEFLIDTGATFIAMNEKTAKRIGLDYKLNGKVGETQTASGVAKAWYLQLDRVTLGKLQLSDVDAAVIKGEYPKDVLLGNSFLNQLDLEREGKLLVLKAR